MCLHAPAWRNTHMKTGLLARAVFAPEDGGSGAGVAPLVVAPAEAAHMLRVSVVRVYQLLRNGELQSYTDGKARRITVSSIQGWVARRLEASKDWRGSLCANRPPPPRPGEVRRRPRKRTG